MANQDSISTTNNSGKIRFIDIPEKYSLEHDAYVTCKNEESLETSGDWIGLFPLGWRSVLQHVTYQWVPDDLKSQNLPIQITVQIPVRQLRKVIALQYYQWAYISRKGEIKALSSKIYFSKNHENVVDETANVSHESVVSDIQSGKISTASGICQPLSRPTSAAVVPWRCRLPQRVMSSFGRFNLAIDCNFNLRPTKICREILHISRRCQSLSSPRIFTLPYQCVGNHSVFIDKSKENQRQVNQIAFNPDHSNPNPIKQHQPMEQQTKNESQPAPLGWMGSGSGENAGDVPTGYSPGFEPPCTQASAISALNTSFHQWAELQLGHNIPEQNDDYRPNTEAGFNKSREHLVRSLLHFLSELSNYPVARYSRPISCPKCGQMAMELAAAQWKALQIENRQRNIINEVTRCRSRIHRQQHREQQHLQKIEQLKAENIRLNNGANAEPPVLEHLRQILATNSQISAEKRTLEKKVTTLMWEKAGLCASLKVQQQEGMMASGSVVQLNRVLLKAQEKIDRLVEHKEKMQSFIDALLATFGYIGYTAIKDPSGNRITLPTGNSALQLELREGENEDGWMHKTRRHRQSDRWYKAVLAAKEGTIQRLQAELASLVSKRDGFSAIHELEHRPNERENPNSTSYCSGDQKRFHGANLSGATSGPGANPCLMSPVNNMHQSDYERQGARPKIQMMTNKRKPSMNNENQESTAPPRLVPPRKRVVMNMFPCPFCPQSEDGQHVQYYSDEHMRMHMHSELCNRRWG